MNRKTTKFDLLWKGLPQHVLRTKMVTLDLFHNKRVAIVGPASTAYVEEKGNYIDNFDIVIRLSRALFQFENKPETRAFVGTKTTMLFHQLMGKSLSTGEIDQALLRKYNVDRLVFSRSSTRNGIRKVLAYYCKHPGGYPVSLLDPNIYKRIAAPFTAPRLKPTNGYNALATVLQSQFQELFITGITFFRTPYSKGYRDDEQMTRIVAEGWHNPDFEYELFTRLLEENSHKNIIMDDGLLAIL
jgi:hypothetical protein